MPASASMMAAFFAFQSETCTASTLRTYYYGVGAAHADELLPFPALMQGVHGGVPDAAGHQA
jgi:hypothetical protein